MHDLDPEVTPVRDVVDRVDEQRRLDSARRHQAALHSQDQRVDNRLTIGLLAIASGLIVLFALWGIIR